MYDDRGLGQENLVHCYSDGAWLSVFIAKRDAQSSGPYRSVKLC
jgi:hypothetical protein